MDLQKQAARLYTEACDIYGREPAVGTLNNSEEVLLYAAVPCRISYGTSPALNQTEGGAEVQQKVTLFCAPGLVLKPGARVVCAGVSYALAGAPKKYQSHQEVGLVRTPRWA